MLGDAGYRTGFFGKWHVSRHYGGYLGWSPTHGPLQQGFATGDADFGSHPWGYLKRLGREYGDFAEGEYPPDALTDRVLQFVRETADQPTFLYWSHYFVHDPVHTRCRWLAEQYAAKLPPGTDSERAAYAAMVQTLDHQVGRLLDLLDELQLTDDTLLVFSSDNGGNPNFSSNGPLRGNKWNLYEGGIREPMVVRWPGVVAPGSVEDEPVVLYDWMPTFAELCGGKCDKQSCDGRSLVPLLEGHATDWPVRRLVWHFPYYHPEKGFDKAPAAIGINDGCTTQTRPQSAIRHGDYKLLHFYEDDRDELYNLTTDPSEQHDLSAAEPSRRKAMRTMLDEYLRQVDARLPETNPAAPQP